jgi:hypothetical protein
LVLIPHINRIKNLILGLFSEGSDSGLKLVAKISSGFFSYTLLLYIFFWKASLFSDLEDKQ